ncbi:MAG: HD-GYP domain-containing protein [Thermodesulfobacteriota bacterium]
MISDDKEQILKSLNAALHSKKLYPPGHPSVAAPVKKCAQTIADHMKDKSKLSICLVDEALVLNDVPVADAKKTYEDLIEHLKARGVEAVIFDKGVVEKELSALFDLLSSEDAPPGPELQGELEKKGVTHITVQSLERTPIEVYNDAVKTVKDVMGEIRMGRIPKSEEVKGIADEMSDKILSDPNAMVGLSMIKNYDDYLYNHSVNVSIISMAIGKFMGLDKEDMHKLGVGSLLHDVGKTGVSEDIIRKPGGLSSDEWEKVKEHPVLGNKISKEMEGIPEETSRIIYEHHIRYDRSGYPTTETGTSIHPLSLIVSVADAYDALTTLRVYQKPYQPVEAVRMIKGLAGKHFDPDVVSSFEQMMGLYPVGTMVRLSTNEIGVVTKVEPEKHDTPMIKVIFDPEGKKIDSPFEVDLSEKKDPPLVITAPVDPLYMNVDMGEFFEQEASK